MKNIKNIKNIKPKLPLTRSVPHMIYEFISVFLRSNINLGYNNFRLKSLIVTVSIVSIIWPLQKITWIFCASCCSCRFQRWNPHRPQNDYRHQPFNDHDFSIWFSTRRDNDCYNNLPLFSWFKINVLMIFCWSKYSSLYLIKHSSHIIGT